MLDVFVGRQPIYNQNLEVFAYELLFRTSKTNRAEFKDADQATSQVILNTFMEIGLDNIVGEKLAFINLTRSFVLGNYFLPLPQTRIALEILEDIKVDKQLIEAVRALAAQGYIIALDDFVYHEDLRPLVDVADIIKIDVLALGRDKLQEHARIFRVEGVSTDGRLCGLGRQRERQPIVRPIVRRRRRRLGDAHQHPAIVQEPPIVEGAGKKPPVRGPARKLRLFQQRSERRLRDAIEPRRIGSAVRRSDRRSTSH